MLLFETIHSVYHGVVFTWKGRDHGIFKAVVVALVQIQDGGGGGSHADVSSKFKMARVDVSTEFKMAVMCVRSWWCFDIQFKMARTFANVQCGNSIIYITYLVLFSCDLRSTSFSNNFDSTDACFPSNVALFIGVVMSQYGSDQYDCLH